MTWARLTDALRSRGVVRGVVGHATEELDIVGIAYDSRRVEPGQIFVALRGLHVDGLAFVDEALERGAVAVVADQPAPANVRVPWVIVDHPRVALAVLASALNKQPSRRLQLVGITGTNGKTTVAFLVASIFEAAGVRCGVLGTVGHRIGEDTKPATHTTPEAPEVEALLQSMIDAGCRACAMEVSSHALALDRVRELVFAAGVFTNLTRDHLDFHPDMEAYFQSKRRLFELLPPEAPGVINVDDPRGVALSEVVERPVTYAVDTPADITPGLITSSLEGLVFDVRTPRGGIHVRSRLIGRANAYNILAAVSTATALGLPFDAIERGIESLQGVPGRFELVSGPREEITVVVDYAHTDDALRNLLETARPLAPTRLITVFGCGGDRDRTKRPLMGAVAGRLSDVILITSDNPRTEDPERIIQEIRRGITPDTVHGSPPHVLTIVDRRSAIAKAIDLARPGDFVLIAGKGHETYQVMGDRVLPFNDASVAREALSRRRSNSGVV